MATNIQKIEVSPRSRCRIFSMAAIQDANKQTMRFKTFYASLRKKHRLDFRKQLVIVTHCFERTNSSFRSGSGWAWSNTFIQGISTNDRRTTSNSQSCIRNSAKLR